MNSASGSASHWEYVDFDLEIGEQTESRRYPISVHSPEGEATEEMRFPFDEWELKDKLRDVEFALLRSGGSRRRIGTPEEQIIQVFGRALFEALLVGEVGTQYRVSWREARRQNKGLRVKLHVKPPELSSLPWEFVYDPKHSYLGLSSRTPLVRYPDVPHPIERLTVRPPLRILGMVASPQGLPQLDVGHEKRLVEEAIRGLQDRGLLELTWLEGQSWRHLQRVMRRGPWHVFHFIGHGGFDPETEEGAIALSDEEGRKHLLGASDLALLLDDHYFLRLAFLNSCEGARGSPRDAFSSTAATLVRAGIPAVVAMQYEITDRAAIEFSRSFYDAVADALPIDAAVAEARTAVKMGSALEWGTPVLYMRSEDGLIFDMPPEGRHTQPAKAAEEAEDEERLLRRYREAVEWAWADGELDRRQAERLRNLVNRLELSSDTAAEIEREVMGATIEEVLEHQEQGIREKERQDRLDQLYARARRSHQNQEWQEVLDVFEQLHAEDPDYPDLAGLLASAREALEIAQKSEDALRRYREGVKSAWTDGELDRSQAERLRDLADELGLNSSAAAGIEREVMDDTIEEILERHEQAVREEERRHHLDELYGRARGLHRDQEWQAVVDVFAQIHAEDPAYPDPEELLQSARNALEMVWKEQDTFRRYREAVEWAWADEDLNGRDVKRLRDFMSRLELSPNTAAQIEREVMGETKEAILDRQEQATTEQYRTAVAEAWTDNELSDEEAEWLSTLASELGLSTDAAADIEREVIGDTIPAILQRQRRLDELYTQARQLHLEQEWQSVVDLFERIHSEDPAFPDPGGLLASAREALERMRKVADLYDEALRYVDGNEWQQALECFEEVQRLEPGYRDTEKFLSRARQELAPPPTVKVPNLSGQEISQASSVLTSTGLKLGAQREAPSDTVSEGLIIDQSLEADTEVEIGCSVSVTVSSGPSTVEVPDLVGKSRAEAKSILLAAGLELGMIGKVSNDDLPEGEIVQQYPERGNKAERGASVRVTVAQMRVEKPKTEKLTKRPLSSRPDFLPEEPEPRQPGRLEDSEGSEEFASQYGRKLEKPPDLPD